MSKLHPGVSLYYCQVNLLISSPYSSHVDGLRTWRDWWQAGLLRELCSFWFQPVPLSKVPNTYPVILRWKWGKIRMSCFFLCRNTARKQLISLAHGPLSSPSKTEWEGGQCGENKRAGAVFMVFSIHWRRGENIFSSHNLWNNVRTQCAWCVCSHVCMRSLEGRIVYA